MSLATEPVFIWLAQYAYEPMIVYFLVWLVMLGGAFGFPLPEEVAIVSLGVLAYMGSHPELFPPPVNAGMARVEPIQAAIVCSLAVLTSDIIVFLLGKVYGKKLLKIRFIARLISAESLLRIEKWTKRYGIWAAGLFRFTPGLRFPGFWTCGMGQLSTSKFLLADGLATMISVPTQIILVALYGESILGFLQKVKYVIFSLILVGIIIYFIKRFIANKIQSEI